MEIGNVTLRTKGLNILQSAIHPKHGLVWTDGKSVYLAKFKIIKNQVQPEKSFKIKEFDFVNCVQWSSKSDSGTCYLSVSHKDGICIWKVEGEAPNLELKQIRKIYIEALPQGCLWNPHRELLCILSREQIRFFYRHGKIRGVYSIPPLESGKISCGAWSEDGLKLVVCVGSAILIYNWRSIDGVISEFDTNVWKIPELKSTVTAITSMQENLFACAAEVPLESLCKTKDMFVVPGLRKQSLVSKEGKEPNKVNSHSNDNEKQMLETTNLNKLMNLRKTSECDVDNLSQLVVIRVKENMKDPEFLIRTSIKGINTPDLLHFQTLKQVLIVGSNIQTSLQLFNFAKDFKLIKLANVELETHSRPKGVCSLPPELSTNSSNGNMLIMLGKRSETNPSIFSTSTESKYELWLQCFSLDNAQTSTEIHQRPNKSERNKTNGHSEYPNNIAVVNSQQSSVSTSPIGSPANDLKEDKILLAKKLLHPVSPQLSSKCMIEELEESEKLKELEIERTDFASTKPNFVNPTCLSEWGSCNAELTAKNSHERSNGLRESASESGYSVSSPISPRSPSIVNGYDQNENQSLDYGYQHLEDKLQFQNNQIAELEKKIEELKREIDKSSCIFPTKYQPLKAPEIINVIHVIPSGISIKKTFLLDHGRLHMESVKQSFGLNTIELYIDGVPVIVSANIDGYIPLKFEPNSTLFISGVTSPAQEDSVSISSLASSAVLPQSPINESKPITDLTVTGALTSIKGKATSC